MVSIIIRTKNEERWISACLNAVFNQSFKDFEVVLVDNNSADRTVEKAKAFDVKIVTIEEYRPGRAINLGIQNSRGDIIVCLSGHCIPVNNDWLSNLIHDLKDPKIAGVYGRQEPMTFTNDQDKRDLLTIFGLDKRIQVKDSFFHNANSAIRRDIWEKFPFDEEVTNIEDRVWGRQVISKGYRIVYESSASVYHHHGIHQDGDPDRCKNVVRILESLENNSGYQNGEDLLHNFDLDALKISVLLPIKGEVQYCGGKPLIEYSIERALESKYIKQVMVSTDNDELASVARKAGAETPFVRPKDLSRDFVGIRGVLQYTLNRLEEAGYEADIIIALMASYPFRPQGFIDYLIEKFIREGTDCLIPVRSESRSAWFRNGDKIEMVSELMPRNLKKEVVYISLLGLGFITYPKFIREGTMIGNNAGIYEVKDIYSQIEVRGEDSLKFAGPILDKYWKESADSNRRIYPEHGKFHIKR